MRSMYTRLAVIVVTAVAGSVLLAGRASAEEIQTFDSTAELRADGSLAVREVIAWDFFPFQDKHGIFRELDVRQQVPGDETTDFSYDVSNISVASPSGAPTDVQESWVDRSGPGIDYRKRIRIGSPDLTVNGVHTYEIDYVYDGLVKDVAEGEEQFSWEVTGTAWPVRMQTVTARITAPAPIVEARCVYGRFDSTTPCEVAVDGATATARIENLPPQQGVTIGLTLPAGAVTPSATLVARDSPGPGMIAFGLRMPAFWIWALVVGAFALICLLALAGSIVRGRRLRREAADLSDLPPDADPKLAAPIKRGDPVITEYEPPDGLRPAELGMLIDETLHNRDLASTLVDLAVRGYITIDEVETDGGKPDWQISWRGAADEADLRPYEKLFVDSLFTMGAMSISDVQDLVTNLTDLIRQHADPHQAFTRSTGTTTVARDPVRLSELRGSFGRTINSLQEMLRADAVDRGWFVREPRTSMGKVAGALTTLGIMAVILTAALIAGFAVSGGKFFWAIVIPALVLVGTVVIAIAASWRTPHRSGHGNILARRAQGFEQLLSGDGGDRMAFAERASIFHEYLPYAVAFGVTDKWAQRFRDMAVAPPEPDWYHGRGAFDAMLFASTMNTFTSRATSDLTYTPSSSSSGSSGGFSGGSVGGGGGGGGGGSW